MKYNDYLHLLYFVGNECNGLSVDEVTARDKFIKYPGGAPANVACALAKLGNHIMHIKL